MRPLLAWARANPIIVLCIAAVPICVAAIIYTAMTGSGLVSEKQKVANRWIKKLESLQRTSVQVPTDDPNEPMKQVSLTITDGAIKQLRRVRDGMDGEYLRILNYVIQRNRDGLSFAHVPMLEGLFPGNNLAETEAGLPFAAQRIYKRTLYEFTLANDAQATGPHLNAGGPLAVDLIAEELERVAEDFRAGFGGQVDADVAQENRKLLHGQQSERLVNLLNERARLIHIYADVPQPDEQNRGEFIFSEQTPFHLGEWAVNSNKPTLEQLWEGQVDLWIQQDIVEAIALSNAGSNNVLDAPIKRLIKIDISPGYVGMGSDGGVVNFESGPTRSRSRRPGIAMRRDMFPPGRMGGPRGMPGMRGFGGAMNMSTDDEADEEEGEGGDVGPRAGGKLKENYELSPTGRRSSHLYDVRHATVTLIVDSKRMPLLLENLWRVNFMTVLVTNVTDVDEYEHLHGTAGGVFAYGPQDAVRLDLVIETIWLRRWTAGHWDEDAAARLREPFEPGLMPDVVREKLKLKRRLPHGRGDNRNREQNDGSRAGRP